MWWIWMILAALFVLGEILRRGSFFLWISFGAASSGILALLGITTPGQIAVFINVSGILIVLERRFSERYTFKQPSSSLSDRENLPSYDTRQLPNDQGDALNVFRRVGPGWEIKYGGESYMIKQSIGLFHIRNLIIKKGEWIHCSELKRLSAEDISEFQHEPYNTMTKDQLEGENLRASEDTLPEDVISHLPLDKIKQLRDALIERRETDDFKSPEEKIDQLNALEFIEKYLNSITDKRGKPRKLHDQSDTDRKAVSAAINRCRNSLKEHKELFTHFQSFIKAESNSFRYQPDRPIDWKTE
jgi:hypothetical protein